MLEFVKTVLSVYAVLSIIAISLSTFVDVLKNSVDMIFKKHKNYSKCFIYFLLVVGSVLFSFYFPIYLIKRTIK